MSQHIVNALLHFPPDFELPEDCEISIRVLNITNRDAPGLHTKWGSNKLSSNRPINFSVIVDSDLNDIGSRFSIDVKISHQGTALLLDMEQNFWWAGGDHDTDIHLSPVGYIAVEKSWMPRIGYPEDSKLFVKLTTDDNPEVVVSEGVSLTNLTAPFYLRYNPTVIKPGLLYALSGSFETYGQRQLSLGIKPAKLVLMHEAVLQPAFGS